MNTPEKSKIEKPASRPLTVNVALISLLFSFGLGSVSRIAWSLNFNKPNTFFGTIFFASWEIWMVFALYRGKNWVRWFFITFYIGGILLLSSHSVSLLQNIQNQLFPISYFIQLLLQLVAVIALVLPPTNRWFREMKSPAKFETNKAPLP